MDQAKVYLAVAKKHHFWILIAIVVVTALVVWFKASSSLATKYETDMKTIVGAQDSVQKATNPEPVNPLFTSKVDKLHDGLKSSVFEAWKQLYERQMVWFRWPDFSEYDANVDLGKFLPDEEIPDFAREIYNEKIVRQEWNNLFENVHLRKLKVKQPSADGDVDLEEESRGVEYEGLVVWSPEKRAAIASRYFVVNARPSTLRIRLAQEDYWLFESLIEVINTVNEGASDTLKAPIKEIQVMDVAQWAIAASQADGGAIWTKESSGTAGAGNSPMGMDAASAMPGAGPGMPGMPGMPADAAGAGGAADAAKGSAEDDKLWLDNRYLDDKGQPLAAGAAQPFAEFKQVFVYMKLLMDQRRIPELVAACANAHLPIETRQIRVRMLKGEGGSGLFPGSPGGMFGGAPMPGGLMGGGIDPMGNSMPGMGPGMMPGMGPDSGMPGYGGPGGYGGAGGFGLGAGGLTGQEGGVETTIYDWLVELSGVIYLYNPADLAQLGTGAVGAPEKRSFGVPTKPVQPPHSSSSNSGGYMGAMGQMGPG